MRHKFGLIRVTGFLLLFICFICFGDATTSKADDKLPYRILVISSYDYSFATVPQHLSGFTEGLGELYVDINYEFMDAKRQYGDSGNADFYSYLSNKLNHTSRFDLVVLVDDTAFQFGLQYSSDLFPDTPIVFMGVNNIEEAGEAAAKDNVTGVAEVLNIEDNISLSSELFPNMSQYVIITDNTNSAKGEYIEFEKYLSSHPEINYRTINMSDYDQQQIKDILSGLGIDSVIIYLDCLRDGNNNLYSLQSAMNMISECAPMIPVWRLSVANTGNGIFGGLTYSYKAAGVMAGGLAAKVLTGTSPKDLPMVTDSVTEAYFDQDELDKYNINVRDLPSDAVILHEHETFYKFYRENTVLANMSLLVVFLMIVIIGILLFANHRKRMLIRRDFLTNMPNRTYITEKLSSVMESGEAFGIVMIDVDKFKTINDTLGHLVGDELLVGVAKRLKSLSSKDFIIARIGGDEFMGLIRKADKNKADKLCKEIVQIMKDDFNSSSGSLHITVSIGCAMYPLDTKKAGSVMGLADDALYDIKEHGRDGYRLYNDLQR